MTGKSYTAGTAEAQAAAGKVGFIIGNDGRANSRTPYSVQNLITKEGKECFILYNPMTGKSRHAKRVFIPHEQPETGPEPIQAGETTATAEKAENEPKKGIKTSVEAAPAYIVQCKGTRRPWTDYSSPATLAECETIKDRAEARRTCDTRGALLIYRIIPTEATQTQMETTGAPEEIQTPMEDGRPAPAADDQTTMEDGGKAGQPADDQTGMDGGKAGGRQTGMETPRKRPKQPRKGRTPTDYHPRRQQPENGQNSTIYAPTRVIHNLHTREPLLFRKSP